MKDDLYYDITMEDYKLIPGLNSSTLKWGHKPSGSMLHLRAAMWGEIESDDTKDRKFGRAVHVRLLEPDRYKSDVLVATTCAAMKKGDGQPCTNNGYLFDGEKWYCGTRGHAPKGAEMPETYVNIEEAARIEQMAETLKTHEAMQILRAKGWSEVTALWTYRGHRMKMRLDRLTESERVIVDLKKAQRGSVHKDAMEKSIDTYDWHRQAALYVDGIKYLTGQDYEFVWIFIEDQPPYDVGIMRASQEVLDCGRFEYRQIIDDLEYAERRNRYDGSNPIPRRIETIRDLDSGGLPGWRLEQYRNIDTAGSFAGFGGDESFGGDSPGGFGSDGGYRQDGATVGAPGEILGEPGES